MPPFVRRLSLGALESWEPGQVHKVWELDPDLLNPEGFLFGGYYGVLADQVGNFAAMTVMSNEELLRTTQLELDYFRSIGEGPVTLTGRVTNKSSKLLHTEVDYVLPDGRLAAKARVVFSLRPVNQSPIIGPKPPEE
ncbi:MAG: PaaI family thioesterase [Candidatus Phaeomarinobacter sp.]